MCLSRHPVFDAWKSNNNLIGSIRLHFVRYVHGEYHFHILLHASSKHTQAFYTHTPIPLASMKAITTHPSIHLSVFHVYTYIDITFLPCNECAFNSYDDDYDNKRKDDAPQL